MAVNLAMVMTTLLKNLVQFAFLISIEIQQVGEMIENSFGRGVAALASVDPADPTPPSTRTWST